MFGKLWQMLTPPDTHLAFGVPRTNHLLLELLRIVGHTHQPHTRLVAGQVARPDIGLEQLELAHPVAVIGCAGDDVQTIPLHGPDVHVVL